MIVAVERACVRWRLFMCGVVLGGHLPAPVVVCVRQDDVKVSDKWKSSAKHWEAGFLRRLGWWNVRYLQAFTHWLRKHTWSKPDFFADAKRRASLELTDMEVRARPTRVSVH